jgi:hypothetical protein
MRQAGTGWFGEAGCCWDWLAEGSRLSMTERGWVKLKIDGRGGVRRMRRKLWLGDEGKTFGDVWRCLEMFGDVWRCLEMFGVVWRCC